MFHNQPSETGNAGCSSRQFLWCKRVHCGQFPVWNWCYWIQSCLERHAGHVSSSSSNLPTANRLRFSLPHLSTGKQRPHPASPQDAGASFSWVDKLIKHLWMAFLSLPSVPPPSSLSGFHSLDNLHRNLWLRLFWETRGYAPILHRGVKGRGVLSDVCFLHSYLLAFPFPVLLLLFTCVTEWEIPTILNREWAGQGAVNLYSKPLKRPSQGCQCYPRIKNPPWRQNKTQSLTKQNDRKLWVTSRCQSRLHCELESIYAM